MVREITFAVNQSRGHAVCPSSQEVLACGPSRQRLTVSTDIADLQAMPGLAADLEGEATLARLPRAPPSRAPSPCPPGPTSAHGIPAGAACTACLQVFPGGKQLGLMEVGPGFDVPPLLLRKAACHEFDAVDREDAYVIGRTHGSVADDEAQTAPRTCG